ncbi:MAG: hypothetical protein ACR2NL_05760 [Acidimicrobiia bacterium]
MSTLHVIQPSLEDDANSSAEVKDTLAETVRRVVAEVVERIVPIVRPRLRVWLAIAVLLSLAAAACSDAGGATTGGSSEDDDTLDNGYVGTVVGTNAFVGVLATDRADGENEAVVYVCNGDEEIREWFMGAIDDPAQITMNNDQGGSVTAEWSDDHWTGEVTLNTGETHTFTTEEATGDAGIYEVFDEEAAAEGIWVAWVVDNDGNERGAALKRGTFFSTPRLSFPSVSFGGQTFATNIFQASSGVIEMNG